MFLFVHFSYFSKNIELTKSENKQMKKTQIIFLLLISLSLLIISCSTVPLTGRSQLNMIPESEMLAMSFQQYDEFLKQNPTSKDQPAVEMVQRAGANIQHAVEKYLVDNNLSDRLQGYKWEFNLVESEQINAWCMPGGKVVVYTGILPIAQNEGGLAVVMGHEIAHAIAEHGNERMSQQLLQQAGAVTLMVAMKDEPVQTQALWLSVYGVGTQLGIMLPYSRTQESEADHLGLIFMAMAGYNPEEAPVFWERMAAGKDGEPPEFLSTHPSSGTRINNLNSWMSEAKQYYTKSAKTITPNHNR
jgi:predicted Zn-dependent protease